MAAVGDSESDEFYATVQWTTSKVTSLGIIAESECLEGDFEIGSTIVAAHRNNSYPAKILFIGTLDAMREKLTSLRRTYKPASNSPKGRGHRVIKKKVLEDFVEVLPSSSRVAASEDGSTGTGGNQDDSKKIVREQNKLKRKAMDDTGDAIIMKLMEQVGAEQSEEHQMAHSPPPSEPDFEPVDLDTDERVSSPDLRDQLEQSQKEVARLQQLVDDLTKKNLVLQKQLPQFLLDMRDMLHSSVKSTPLVKSVPGPSSKQVPRRPASESSKQVLHRPAPESSSKQLCRRPAPESSVSKPAFPSTPHGDSNSSSDSSENDEGEFVIPDHILRKIGSPRGYGAYTCDLLGALFPRKTLAKSCLSKKHADGKKDALLLPSEKVQAITDKVMERFPSVQESAIRIKISTKLRDEKSRFNKLQKELPLSPVQKETSSSGSQGSTSS